MTEVSQRARDTERALLQKFVASLTGGGKNARNLISVEHDRLAELVARSQRVLATPTAEAGLRAIADRLLDQQDEPCWTEEGHEGRRLHYWRDKAIDAANALIALQTSAPGGGKSSDAIGETR
jgi:hypothetical protein